MSEILLLANPSKHKRQKRTHKAKRKHSRRSSRVAKRSHRIRARSNPSMRDITGQVVPTLKAGAYGAVGGLLNDLAFGFGKGYLPVSMQSGMSRHAIKILSSVLIGMAGNLILKGKGAALANGAATVAIHEALKEQIALMAPSLPLGAMDEAPGLLGYNPGDPVDGYDDGLMGEYLDTGMGEYVDGGIGDSDDD